MTYFMQNGDGYFPTAGRESMLDELPTGNYVVTETLVGLYFKRVPQFEPTGKLYGDVQKRADRVLRTFLDRPRATGALFAGEKGSGKSLLARTISLTGYDMGIPTILVNGPFHGDGFSNLLASIEQPAIVLMDEFEKVYSKEQQEGVLTLLDGTMTSKKLFVLTVNNKYGVDANMRNRPGRLFYSLDFSGLESDFVRDYCNDELENKDHTESVVKMSSMFESFNFDMLKALVEEMNRYEEDPYDALEMLNAKPVDINMGGTKYDVEVKSPAGKLIKYESTYDQHPMSGRRGQTYIYVLDPENPNAEDSDNEQVLYFEPKHLTQLDADKGVYSFTTDSKYKITFTKQVQEVYNYRGL